MESISVLLVDDEPSFREILCKRLTKRGLRVQGAGSALEGLELIGQIHATQHGRRYRSPQ
jgi:CheY-like chemotaxis protein